MLRNCPRCGRIFRYVGKPVCPQCVAEEEKEFELVRTYLREHPQASVFEAAQATGVPTTRIYSWARQGRLALRGEGGAPALTCQACGRPIETGRLCTECLAALQREAERAAGAGRPRRAEPGGDQSRSTGESRVYVRERFGER